MCTNPSTYFWLSGIVIVVLAFSVLRALWKNHWHNWLATISKDVLTGYVATFVLIFGLVAIVVCW